jgi:hypothetical protein
VGLRLRRALGRLLVDLVVIRAPGYFKHPNSHLALGRVKKANRIDKVEGNPSW